MFASPEPNFNDDETTLFGVVKSVDLQKNTAIVQIGDIETAPIEWLTRAGSVCIWCPPSVGEQVVVHAPDGDMAGAYIAGSIFSNVNPPAVNGEKCAIHFPNGDNIIYDFTTHNLTINAAGNVQIVTPTLALDGNLTCTGTITANIDVIGGGKSLKDHVHIGVKTGAEISGKPQ